MVEDDEVDVHSNCTAASKVWLHKHQNYMCSNRDDALIISAKIRLQVEALL